jgi:hypothetical protein
MLFKKKKVVGDSENFMKDPNKLCGYNEELLNVNAGD